MLTRKFPSPLSLPPSLSPSPSLTLSFSLSLSSTLTLSCVEVASKISTGFSDAGTRLQKSKGISPSLSLSLSLTHTQAHTHTFSLSLMHANKLINFVSVLTVVRSSLSHTLTNSHPLAFSLTHTHIRTHAILSYRQRHYSFLLCFLHSSFATSRASIEQSDKHPGFEPCLAEFFELLVMV